MRRIQLSLGADEFDHTQKLLRDVFDKCQELNTPWMTLYALQLCKVLEREHEGKTLQIDYRAMFNAFINQLEKHTQSEALKEAFHSAKTRWEDQIL